MGRSMPNEGIRSSCACLGLGLISPDVERRSRSTQCMRLGHRGASPLVLPPGSCRLRVKMTLSPCHLLVRRSKAKGRAGAGLLSWKEDSSTFSLVSPLPLRGRAGRAAGATPSGEGVCSGQSKGEWSLTSWSHDTGERNTSRLLHLLLCSYTIKMIARNGLLSFGAHCELGDCLQI